MEPVKTIATREAEVYGDPPMVQSLTHKTLEFTQIADLTEAHNEKTVLIRARVHNSRAKANLVFLELRQNFNTIQAACFKSDQTPKEMIKYIASVANESIVDVEAVVKKVDKEIKSTSVKFLELHIKRFFVVNRSNNVLPFQLEDASRKVTKDSEDGETSAEGPTVSLTTRLDNRIIDLRTPANQAIFRIQSAVCRLFRDFLYSKDFIELHSPKLQGGSSEGGANVFKLKYFEKDACLAQSPQLFKQMMVMADFERVFEIGPVFRAENANTHRHMCEFTGLDLEMTIKESYLEILEILGGLFHFIFKGLTTTYARELAAINEQFPFEPFLFSEQPLILDFAEGIKMLHEAGVEQAIDDDLSTVTEKQLGKLVKDKYKTDFYILHRYPETARPFYTMLCHDNPKYTCSYDVFMRGEEIISGAQRIHDPVLLAQRATVKGIPVNTIKDYIDAFKYGAYPHGGAGVGLERVVMLFCNLGNIRKSCAFPRDPQRLAP
jgi:aspartyl-tRNA synthetase